MTSRIKTTFSDRDEFKRKPIAEKLISIFGSELEIGRIALNGPWGSGKTEFCHKFIDLIHEGESGLKCRYIDAFQFDHSDDPLIMLVSSVVSLIEDQNEKKDLYSKALPIAKVFSKVAAKSALSWVLRTDAEGVAKEIAEAVADEGGDAIDDGITKAFERLENVDSDIKAFKLALEKIAKKQPILIVVDELDRCRPTFALSILEKIKHVFDVPGVKFLFSVNLKQLESATKKLYGLEIDADSYLSKFFDLIIKLPEDFTPNNIEFFRNSASVVIKEIKGDSNFKSVNGLHSSVLELITDLFRRHSRSIRDAELYIRNLKLFNLLAGNSAIRGNTIWGYAALSMFGVYISTFFPEFAAKVLNKQFTSSDVSDFLGIEPSVFKSPPNAILGDMYAVLIFELKDPGIINGIDQKMLERWEKSVMGLLDGGFTRRPEDLAKIIRDAIRVMQLQQA